MSKHFMRHGVAAMALLGLAAVGSASVASPAFAATVNFKADLSGGSEVPPTDSKATGAAKVTFDDTSKLLTWSVTYADLTGEAAAAHFHGPADVGAAAGPVVPITGTASPMEGSVTLTDQQAADLLAGKWYVNVHTAKFPDGEIRGQVVKAE